MDPLLSVLINAGVGGALAALLLTRTFPAMLKTFSKEQAALRAQHESHINKIVNRLEAVERHIAEIKDRFGKGPCLGVPSCSEKPPNA